MSGKQAKALRQKMREAGTLIEGKKTTYQIVSVARTRYGIVDPKLGRGLQVRLKPGTGRQLYKQAKLAGGL